MAIVLTIINKTASPLSYLSGAVTVAGSGSTTVSATYLRKMSADGALKGHCLSNTVQLSDGTNIYGSVDAVDYLKLIFNSLYQIAGGTDETTIGNVGDRLKVDALVTLVPDGTTATGILKQNEITIATKTETDLGSTTYTVPSGKTFKLTTFGGSYDTQSPMYVRFKKQTGGTGSFATLFRISLKQQGQDESNFQITMPMGLNIGVAGDVFKITYESALSKGTLWAGFTGVEF